MTTDSATAALFEDCTRSIKDADRRIGHAMGWRFLASSRATFRADAPLMLMTLNPGGDHVSAGHGEESCELGSAYVHERWGGARPGESRLQRQVQQLFEWLRCEPDAVLAAYFVPFRSPSLASLHAPRESFAFAEALWREVFQLICPPLIVCIGNDVDRELRNCFEPLQEQTAVTLGWGEQRATISRFARTVVLRFPHLSRYSVFGRRASEQPLRQLRSELDGAVSRLK